MVADAFEIFRLASAGYCCSQIMMIFYLKQNNLENIPAVKAMASLCGGLGNLGKTCGVVTAGTCILGMYAGKGEDAELKDGNLKKMIKEYTDWFEEEFEGTECVDIVSVDVLKDINEYEVYPTRCGSIIQKSYNKLNSILQEYGYI